MKREVFAMFFVLLFVPLAGAATWKTPTDVFNDFKSINDKDYFSRWSSLNGEDLYYNNGSVGIGITKPKALFHVNSSSATFVINGSSGNVGIGTASPQRQLHIDGTSSIISLTGTAGNKSWLLFGTTADDNSGGVGYSITNEEMYFRTNDDTRVTIDNSGNVGIGDTNPNVKLVVNGDTNITGDLNITGQLWINNVNNTAPDYVFEEDYNLLSLEELKKHVEENHRLPDSEIQGGFNLDTQTSNILSQQYYLLEKIEEIYVHLFGHEDRLTALEEENKELRERIEILENRR